ncbi:MAG: N-acetylmuramoyl-L-alanine amidase [Gemmatimonadales bacterium]
MIGLLVLLGALVPPRRPIVHPIPAAILVATPRGQSRVPVILGRDGAPMLPAAGLAAALGARLAVADGWAEFTVATLPFRFLLGAPFVAHADRLDPLAAGAFAAADTVYLPLEFVASVLPRTLVERYSWDPVTARLLERGPVVPPRRPPPARLPNGLLPGHVVVIDPGHGGIDPGNPGLYFPHGLTEKDITLAVGRLVAQELERRGVHALMTRTTDTLISLRDRGPMCRADCDLFVSLHVNSLDRRRGYTEQRGYETYFLSEARTEDADRTAKMENEAMRYEAPAAGAAHGGSALDFIFRDLQVNEHLRESARLASLIQEHLAAAHTGPDRGVKQAGFMVLTTASRPAVLVEMGYSTNRADASLMTSRSGQHALAGVIADAVVAYLLEYERKTSAGQETGAR